MYLKILKSAILLMGLALLGQACSQQSEKNQSEQEKQEVEAKLNSPAGPNSHLPFMTKGKEGSVYLSWVEETPNRPARLLFSKLTSGKWSQAKLIAEGEDWFLNWADYPSLMVNDGGLMLAHFLQKSGGGTYAYDVMLTLSQDGGETWSKPFPAHDDGTATEHGFLSGFPMEGGNFRIAWLDGRNTLSEEKKAGGHDHDHEGGNDDPWIAMNLRTAIIDKDGQINKDEIIDHRVCDCCQTTAAWTDSGPVIVYRDRSKSEEEVRDISILRKEEGEWVRPAFVYEDHWQINGCPVNGPRVDARGNKLAIAWFSAAGDSPSVKMAFSDNGGASFGEPIKIDEGDPLGRVDVAWGGEGQAAVVWMEANDTLAEIKVSLVEVGKGKTRTQVVDRVDVARSSGFPSMVYDGREWLITWTSKDSVNKVKVKRIGF